MWIGIIITGMILLPAVIVLAGGFYSPALLESVQRANQQPGGVGAPEGKPMDDYREQEVIETLAKVIPPSSPIEAIKAQAVIVRTYMLRRELGIVEENGLGKMSKEEMENLWKDDFEEIYETYESAAYGTQGEVVFYKEEPIEPVYHKESAGKTRDALGLYNIDVPYLKPVESPYDKNVSEVKLPKTEVAQKLQKAYPEIVVDAAYIENQIQIVQRDEAGYIESLQIGNVLLTGEEFRNLFQLSSAAITMYVEGEQLVFKTAGTGHGVGLSQNGAAGMALEGRSYKEIIEHYYTDVTIHK